MISFGVLPPGTIATNVQIPDTVNGGFHPGLVDIYAPLVVTEALICLHGGGGTKENSAYFTRTIKTMTATPTIDDVNWSLLNYWGTVLAFPQGTACLPENAEDNPFNPNGVSTISETNPAGVNLWSNGMFWSGSDSEQFLLDIKAYITAAFPTVIRQHLYGHSAGGMMVQWMWLNNPAFNHHAVTAGPMPILNIDYTGGFPVLPITPSTLRPFWFQIGRRDTNIGVKDGLAGVGDHWEDDLWLQQYANLSKACVKGSLVSGEWVPQLSEWVNEMQMLQLRVDAYNTAYALPPETFDAGDAVDTATAFGTLSTWQYSSGRNILRLLSHSDHKVGTMTKDLQGSVLKGILAWIRAT